jgi:hypothetical protein
MGSSRKLQIEIDRTLKKVAEGTDTFNEIWKKVKALPFTYGHSSLSALIQVLA